MALPHIRELDKLSSKGVGIGCIHYAVEVPEDEGGEWWLKWMGGYFETNLSVNPHWTAEFDKLPEHPVARGVKPFSTNDEWYYNMRFRDDMEGVTPILTADPARQHAPGQGRPPRRQPRSPQGDRQEPARARRVGQRKRQRLPRLRHHRRPRPLELGPGRLAQRPSSTPSSGSPRAKFPQTAIESKRPTHRRDAPEPRRAGAGGFRPGRDRKADRGNEQAAGKMRTAPQRSVCCKRNGRLGLATFPFFDVSRPFYDARARASAAAACQLFFIFRPDLGCLISHAGYLSAPTHGSFRAGVRARPASLHAANRVKN